MLQQTMGLLNRLGRHRACEAADCTQCRTEVVELQNDPAAVAAQGQSIVVALQAEVRLDMQGG